MSKLTKIVRFPSPALPVPASALTIGSGYSGGSVACERARFLDRLIVAGGHESIDDLLEKVLGQARNVIEQLAETAGR